MTRHYDTLLDTSAEFRTPFLVIDVPAARRNIARMSDLAGGTGVQLRPHFKAHKCPDLMRLQIAAPHTIGATCQTVEEAAELARLGCRDVLLTNQIIDSRTAESFVGLPQDLELSLLVDAPEQVGVIGDSAAAVDRTVTVYIELDVGLTRGGFRSDDPRVDATVDMIETHGHLTLGGIQAYEGHAVLEPHSIRRALVATEAYVLAAEFRDRLSRHVGRQLRLTGGGTGTAEQIANAGALDEIQCGSYLLMDAAYSELRLPFEMALYCVTTVLSTHPDGRVLLDAGTKSMSGDGLPRACSADLDVLGMSDEHSRAVQTADLIHTGDRLLLQPWHVDPTMNLHAEVVMVDEGPAPRVAPLRGHHRLNT